MCPTETTDALAVLADGVIPADARDAGAAVVNAGPRLAEGDRGPGTGDRERHLSRKPCHLNPVP